MKRFNGLCRRSNRRRAAVAVLTAVTLVVLLICASLAVDLGFVRAVCGDMQHTADAGALAGASALIQSDGDDTDAARERALDVIQRMQKSQGFEALEDQIIEFGTWDYETHEFTAGDATASKAFAVRVVGVRRKTPLFFASILGKFSTDVTREAVALGSGRCGGIWGLEGVVAGSINTDSYNSTEGPYLAANAHENGDICSGRDIKCHGSFDIRGDVMPGFGHIADIAGNSGEITGYTTSNSGALPEADVDPGSAKYSNDNAKIPLNSKGKKVYKSQWNISMSAGENLALPAGTYYFDTLKLTGGSTVTVTGPTTIYMAGELDATGGTITNQSTNPHDLTILSAGSSVKLGGGAVFYGSIVAPYGVVTLGSGCHYYGSVLGKKVELKGDVSVHVDESLPILVDAPMASLVK